MAAEGVLEFTNDNFQALVLESDKPVVVDFWAEWCGPCRMIAPAIDQIAHEHADIVVGKVDIDAHPELAQRYGVQGIPFVGLFENGALARHAVGAQPKASIERALGLTE